MFNPVCPGLCLCRGLDWLWDWEDYGTIWPRRKQMGDHWQHGSSTLLLWLLWATRSVAFLESRNTCHSCSAALVFAKKIISKYHRYWSVSFLTTTLTSEFSLSPSLSLSAGFIYVIGGISDEGMELRSAEVYDPISRRWSALPVMVTRRAYVGVACLNNCIYAVGGWNEALGALETVEKYCPEEVLLCQLHWACSGN